ncbi:UDP-2-acetamido-2,6-beta-L-arabino-hexul-4-ose reductase [Pseudomonas mosselii]|uniref:UDP-2-acetamido-2,6-beta-L-arabino-hexul-4-ose reductase n=1 Tax=Pseudomonas mosselii TaxID=78327 RepID=UPI002614FA0E|nr:NAD-dependent epimerase/dehydratase family protein [Pseudomonas mosselii]MDN4496652.1 NAD-dependent epimerase/dehydratase family protein [Pseudomonas mosselii]
MNVLITGGNGFIGRNLQSHLHARNDVQVTCHDRCVPQALSAQVAAADFIFHLAGVNRPDDTAEFATGNADFTSRLCEAILASGRRIPVVYSSSIQALADNPYGRSKRSAEQALADLSARQGGAVHVFRLPNVFGKWARPNYNSMVATFCHNIANGLTIQIHDASAVVNLVYIDDVVRHFIGLMDDVLPDGLADEVKPVYSTTVGQVAELLEAFRDSRSTLTTEAVGTGLARALHSTYLSYLPAHAFSYELPGYSDPRGTFVEMLKTRDSGQFAYFTAKPGVTRGGHYHHTKTEKFLVIRGSARFGFRHIQSGETYELYTDGGKPVIVETVPGWTHDVTNIGDDELIVMLWANEVFDRQNPDTYAMPVRSSGE